MAASPPKEPDVEQTQSGEEEGDMSRQDDTQGGALGDFEVKEQDRWLPIANGWCIPFFLCVTPAGQNLDLSVPCVTLSFACWYEEKHGLKQRGTDVRTTLHVRRTTDKQNTLIRRLFCLSSQLRFTYTRA